MQHGHNSSLIITMIFAGASVANIGKNVGFLAASASRAAIHQSLSQGGSPLAPVEPTSLEETSKSSATMKSKRTAAARSSNLGDVTAKSGSQAIVASLLGTAVGIFLSRTFCSDYGTAGILAGFVVLSAVHQMCTYKAVKVVPLRSLDRHRLHIVLTSYIAGNRNEMVRSSGRNNCGDEWASVDLNSEGYVKPLSPSQVAEKESFLPIISPDNSVHWLTVGAALMDICPLGATELKGLLLPNPPTDATIANNNANVDTSPFDSNQYEKYILKVGAPSSAGPKNDSMIQLTFLEGATDDDILRGMFHAYTAHTFAKDLLSNGSNSDWTGSQILTETHTIMNSRMPVFVENIREVGWQLGTGFVNVECGSSHRLKIQNVNSA